MRAVRFILIAIMLAAIVGAVAPTSRAMIHRDWGDVAGQDFFILRLHFGELRFIVNTEIEDDGSAAYRKNKRLMGARFRYVKSGSPQPAFLLAAEFGAPIPSNPTQTSYYCVSVPCYWFAILAACYPCFFKYRTHTRRRARRLANACLYCGYDLTGNQSGVCSECGERVEAVA